MAQLVDSSNLVHILQLGDLNLVIRVPATAWRAGLTADAAQALESPAAALRLMQRKTNIPVLRVLALDTTCANDVGAPAHLHELRARASSAQGPVRPKLSIPGREAARDIIIGIQTRSSAVGTSSMKLVLPTLS